MYVNYSNCRKVFDERLLSVDLKTPERKIRIGFGASNPLLNAPPSSKPT